ncbi:four helix bundle protein [Pleurocapsa sp. PCC 7319]|uniref:four helix bundle protein n=1 Tax=Pleurocapsa sp. PCC 7319 TaxID=118161 RepID=UPI00034680AF|nr:four helix bundle protein [Pleurocapsa sp. PCC 7319]
MSDEKQKIQDRTLSFAVRVVKLCKFLSEQSDVTRVLYKQLIRSGTSIGANVREAQSAQSDRDFLHKLEIALKEARETEYWLILLVEADLVKEQRIRLLRQECEEIIKILVVITKKIKQKIQMS